MKNKYKIGQKIGVDNQSVDVCIGDYIQKVDNKESRYQVRVRNNLLVKHFGAGFIELDPKDLKDFLKVQALDNEAILGPGADLFKKNIIV